MTSVFSWLAMVAVMLVAATQTLAGEGAPAGAARADLLKSQSAILDRRAADGNGLTISHAAARIIVPGTPEALEAAGVPNSPYLEVARRAASDWNIPEVLFLRLVNHESRWNPRAVSPKGALGLAQLMPQTARLMRVDPMEPHENLAGGARYLRMMYDRFGSWPLALAAYNAGPEAVERYRGIPPYDETRTYVAVIWGPVN